MKPFHCLGDPKTRQRLKQKLEKIRLLFIDVDGVLTDGRLLWTPEGWTRQFHVHDGYGIRRWMHSGRDVALMTAAQGEDIQARAKWLGIEHVLMGSEDKLSRYLKLVQALSLKEEQTAYIADELFDLPVLRKVGLSVSVPDAVEAVQKEVHCVTRKKGGFGAVRELIEVLLEAQGLAS